LAIALYALLRFTASDYTFSISNLNFDIKKKSILHVLTPNDKESSLKHHLKQKSSSSLKKNRIT
jgi:hypothetical protein